MKNRNKILSGFIAMCMLSSSAGATFSDISSEKLAQTAYVLNSLKIMQGSSNTTFSPQKNITRAEFSKILVTMLGITDVTAYKNYTIFPDVPSTHWAAGYINAAVRHPELEKKGIIKGYADGTFKPNETISYAEACTMLLLALGYTVDEIGPMWPADYIARAEAIGLKPDNRDMSQTTVVNREDAAYMLFNAITFNGKDGKGKIIDLLTSSSDSEGAILIATSKTDSELSDGQAKFYINGEIIRKNIDLTIDDSMIGTRGTLYYSKQSPSTVLFILPETSSTSEEHIVKSVRADKIETESGKIIKPKNETMVYINGSVGKYGENWFNLLPNDRITVDYDSNGNISLIRTMQIASVSGSFIYGTETEKPIPSGYKIIKNGFEIGKEKLSKYDVITIDSETKTAFVCDTKITGVYEYAEPSYQNPSKIRVLGKEFNIAQNIAGYFSGLKQGEKITLLLNNNSQVVAAYPSTRLSENMVGILQMKGDKAQVKLLNGVILNVSINEDTKNLVGQLVTVNQNSSQKVNISKWNNSYKEVGNWEVSQNKLGNRNVSQNVIVLEQVSDNSPIYETQVKDLPFDVITNSNIKSTIIDKSGTIIAVLLGDVTGDAYNYGFGSILSNGNSDDFGEDAGPKPPVVAALKIYDYESNSEKILKYNLSYPQNGITNGIIGIPKYAENRTDKQQLDIIQLKNIGNVKLTDFDTSNGVKTSAGYYKISDEVQVYAKAVKKYLTLNQAKSDYNSFTLYAEKTADKGGKIRFIMVE